MALWRREKSLPRPLSTSLEREHLDELDLKCVRKAPDVHERRITLSSFYSSDVGTVQAAALGQLLFGDAEPLSGLAYRIPLGDGQLTWHLRIFFIGQAPRYRLLVVSQKQMNVCPLVTSTDA